MPAPPVIAPAITEIPATIPPPPTPASDAAPDRVLIAVPVLARTTKHFAGRAKQKFFNRAEQSQDLLLARKLRTV